MNERIKQLWEDNDTIEVCYPEQGSPVSVSATTLEKFAELIVRECALFMETNTKVNDDGEVVDVPHAWQMIDHFGTKCLTFTFGVEE